LPRNPRSDPGTAFGKTIVSGAHNDYDEMNKEDFLERRIPWQK
jgi:hypothetical protein